MSDKLFDKYFNKSADEVLNAKKDLIANKVKRGFASTIDQLKDLKLDKTMELEELRVKVANGDVDNLVDLAEIQIELIGVDETIAMIAKEQDAFFGE